MAKIYLCREHINVGDELIHTASTDADKAYNWAQKRRLDTRTQNFDVVEDEDMEKRKDL